MARDIIAKVVMGVGGDITGAKELTCSSNEAVTAGRLVYAGTAASTIVTGSVASVAHCIENTTTVFGIAVNTTTGNGKICKVIPIRVGDILNIMWSTTGGAGTPSVGTIYGLNAAGKLASNQTTYGAFYKVLGNVVSTSGFESCDVLVTKIA